MAIKASDTNLAASSLEQDGFLRGPRGSGPDQYQLDEPTPPSPHRARVAISLFPLWGPLTLMLVMALLWGRGDGETGGSHARSTPMVVSGTKDPSPVGRAADGRSPLPQPTGVVKGDSPADITPDHPWGVPLTSRSWVLRATYAGLGGRGNMGAILLGIDDGVKGVGTGVTATHAGRVKLLRGDARYGNLVYVQGTHYTTTYGHLADFRVTENGEVERGTVLGTLGKSGAVTDLVLDYQVWLDGVNQDPGLYGITGDRGLGGR